MKKSFLYVLACFVLASFALFSLRPQAFAAHNMSGCAKHCTDCQSACEKATAYCKAKGGSAASIETQQKFADCIDICRTSASFLERDSKFHPEICNICAQVCKECAKACQSLKDPKLKDCIDKCNTCADSCSHMAS